MDLCHQGGAQRNCGKPWISYTKIVEHIDLAWEHCRSLLAVIRHGSLSAAARALGLTQPTLSRHISGLEAALGAALFTRSPHGLRPTEVAQAILPHAEAMASAAAALVRSASGAAAAVAGIVRIAASEMIGVEVLPPILAEVGERYPDVAVELALSNRNEDLLRRDVDLAVRMVRPAQVGLVARQIGKVQLGLYAHRRYVERHGSPETAADLSRHRLVGFDREWPGGVLGSQALDLSPADFGLRTDSDLAQLAAVRAGGGIGVVQDGIAVRERELVPVLRGVVAFELPMWLAMHEDLRLTARVRAVFDVLADALSEYAGHQVTGASRAG